MEPNLRRGMAAIFFAAALLAAALAYGQLPAPLPESAATVLRQGSRLAVPFPSLAAALAAELIFPRSLNVGEENELLRLGFAKPGPVTLEDLVEHGRAGRYLLQSPSDPASPRALGDTEGSGEGAEPRDSPEKEVLETADRWSDLFDELGKIYFDQLGVRFGHPDSEIPPEVMIRVRDTLRDLFKYQLTRLPLATSGDPALPIHATLDLVRFRIPLAAAARSLELATYSLSGTDRNIVFDTTVVLKEMDDLLRHLAHTSIPVPPSLPLSDYLSQGLEAARGFGTLRDVPVDVEVLDVGRGVERLDVGAWAMRYLIQQYIHFATRDGASRVRFTVQSRPDGIQVHATDDGPGKVRASRWMAETGRLKKAFDEEPVRAVKMLRVSNLIWVSAIENIGIFPGLAETGDFYFLFPYRGVAKVEMIGRLALRLMEEIRRRGDEP